MLMWLQLMSIYSKMLTSKTVIIWLDEIEIFCQPFAFDNGDKIEMFNLRMNGTKSAILQF